MRTSLGQGLPCEAILWHFQKMERSKDGAIHCKAHGSSRIEQIAISPTFRRYEQDLLQHVPIDPASAEDVNRK